MFRKDPFLALYFSLSLSNIFLLLCLLPSAAHFTLTIWPFSPPPRPPPLRWRHYKELCFDWSAGPSTGVFLNPRKCEASFFLVDSHQANLQPNLLLLGPRLSFNLTPTFLGGIFDRTLSYFKHVFSPMAKLFPRLKALRYISASSWGPFKESFFLLYKAFFWSLSTYASPGWIPFSSITKLGRLHRAASRAKPAASRSPLSYFFSPSLLYLHYESL